MRGLRGGSGALVRRLEDSHLGANGFDILGARRLGLLEAVSVRLLGCISGTSVRRL